MPLPEDRDLQGFLPLEKSFENLRFTNTALEGDIITLNKLRAVRILHLGRCLAQNRINGSAPISITTEEETGDSRFTSTSNGAGLSNELIKELEELSLNKELKQLNTSMSPVLSEAASSNKSSVETDIEISADKKIFQGILKPQGSLERNRDSISNVIETSGTEACSSLSCARKPRQNIAMQAIMRRAETEQKQVTFKNVSPVIVEEENDKKTKAPIVPPTISTSMASKPTSILEMPKANEVSTINNTLVSASNRLSVMPLASSTGSQNQSVLVQGQQRPVKLPPNIPMPVQMMVVEEQPAQQIAQQVAQQMLPQMHTSGMTTGQQTSTLGPICYPNQSFNAQNPQFANNFMTNRPPLTPNAPHYQIQGQLSNNGQSVSTISQSINGIHHSINQSRPLHQRMSQNVSHSPAQLLQQNLRLGSPAQPSMLPQSMNLPANNIGLQANIKVEQNHAIGLQPQQQNMIPSNSRSSNMHNQLNMNGSSGMANVSTMMPTLSVYEKDQQSGLTALVNSQSPTSGSNFQLNFNQNHFNQNQTFVGQGSLSQNQPSPSFYKNNPDAMDFQFSNQTKVVNKNQQSQQQPVTNNYNMFCNYEPTEQFNLWRDNRPPQPPIAWWGAAGNTAAQMHIKDTTVNDNAFSNWSDSSGLGNIASRVPLTPGKNYQQQQNGQHNRHLMTGNNFDDSRLFEVSTIILSENTYKLYIIYIKYMMRFA